MADYTAVDVNTFALAFGVVWVSIGLYVGYLLLTARRLKRELAALERRAP